MNSNKETDNEEKRKIMDEYHSLEKTVEINMENIVSYKSKLETTNEGISVKKKMIEKYETKLEIIVTELLNVEWNQTKAKIVQKSDSEYITNIKTKHPTQQETSSSWKSLEDDKEEIAKLIEKKVNLEKECKRSSEQTEELLREYYKLQNCQKRISK